MEGSLGGISGLRGERELVFVLADLTARTRLPSINFYDTHAKRPACQPRTTSWTTTIWLVSLLRGVLAEVDVWNGLLTGRRPHKLIALERLPAERTTIIPIQDNDDRRE